MRDYIYLGDRLLAEYQPQTGQIYYYTSDQVNSTRVVTDQNGVRVFAAVYDPYGGIQKIWENSYSPAMKFSGKERDSESNLDYFGARYYENYYYRWLSPDPVINKDAALTNPQLWNLYAFCRNSPVTYWDPDGMDTINVFFGFGEKDRGRTSTGGFANFPDFKPLSEMASKAGHSLNFKEYSSAEFAKSLQTEDTWTFAVGHSLISKTTGKAIGLRLSDGVFASPVNSPNRFVGVFSCHSSDFLFSLIAGPTAFAVESGADKSSAHGLAMGAEYLIRMLIQNHPADQAAVYATKMMRNSQIQADQNDKIVMR